MTVQTSGQITAQANPALLPYVPNGKTTNELVHGSRHLNQSMTSYYLIDDGYKKLGAYSLVKGAFNVNSTSVKAWAALLRPT